MNKKILKSIILILLMAAVLSLSACVNPDAQDYRADEGVTTLIFYDGENYYAQFIVIADDLTVMPEVADGYMLNALKTGFDAEKREDYPSQTITKGFETYNIFYYFAKLPEDIWFLGSNTDAKYGFLNATVRCDFENPFADAYKSGTAFNKVYEVLKNGNSDLAPAQNYFDDFDIDALPVKFMINTKANAKAETGSVSYDESYYYYQIAGSLNDTREGGTGSRIVYTYTVMASYGWFTLAVVIGLITVGLILLLAQKKDGKTIDLTNKPGPFSSGRDPFGPYGGATGDFATKTGGTDKKPDIFEGF